VHKPETERVRSLIPFIDFRWGPQEKRYRVIPIFDYRLYVQPLGGEDLDWTVLLFLFGGHDPVEGSYFAFFPFGGKLKGLLGHDETTFVLFPAYWHWRTKERHSAHVVWPLYNEVWGGDDRIKAWPFYGHYRSNLPDGALRYDRTFILRPFYIRRHDQMHYRSDRAFTFRSTGSERTAAR
jgi:hypothetical protein